MKNLTPEYQLQMIQPYLNKVKEEKIVYTVELASDDDDIYYPKEDSIEYSQALETEQEKFYMYIDELLKAECISSSSLLPAEIESIITDNKLIFMRKYDQLKEILVNLVSSESNRNTFFHTSNKDIIPSKKLKQLCNLLINYDSSDIESLNQELKILFFPSNTLSKNL